MSDKPSELGGGWWAKNLESVDREVARLAVRGDPLEPVRRGAYRQITPVRKSAIQIPPGVTASSPG